ncbi:MAG TPA: substrate-binding domain-containing protein, partial [Ktedonobacteraceae bacterium]|nr:substrate-binding domain-containing protein [Ktedonobacteraceae bacterium]
NSLLATDPSITAIITSNAWISGGITRALHDKKLQMPADISLVGIIPPRVAEMTNPTLTAIDFPFYEMGRMGADMLIRQLEGEEVATQVLLTPPLTIRQSSGPCMKGVQV